MTRRCSGDGRASGSASGGFQKHQRQRYTKAGGHIVPGCQRGGCPPPTPRTHPRSIHRSSGVMMDFGHDWHDAVNVKRKLAAFIAEGCNSKLGSGAGSTGGLRSGREQVGAGGGMLQRYSDRSPITPPSLLTMNVRFLQASARRGRAADSARSSVFLATRPPTTSSSLLSSHLRLKRGRRPALDHARGVFVTPMKRVGYTQELGKTRSTRC